MRDEEESEAEDLLIVIEPLFFINLYSLFKVFINSDTATGIYKGIAHFINNLTELYYTLYWSNSIRTTSREYIYFPIGNNVGKAIFPLDFIYFKYFDIEYNRYLYYLLEEDDNRMLYISRIKCVSKSYTSDYTDYSGKITIIVQEYLTINKIDDEFPRLSIGIQNEGMKFKGNELVIRINKE